ncbi:MAG: glycosyltransferase family 2 protein [Bryobacteraceae bacterium]|jgi:GT2 family glycosyltransferase
MEETQTPPPQVSVLIVCYNRAAALDRCLKALEQSEGRETFEIIVVDNGSLDGSAAVAAEFPAVTLLRLPRNFGLTKALNIAMRTAKAELFLLLNPRTEVQAGTVTGLAAPLAEQSDAVAVCPLLVTPEGRPALQLFRLPRPETVAALARAGAFQPADAPEGAGDLAAVEFAGFAALMIRGYFLKALRYIDERYAHAWADAEVAVQIRRAGRKTLLAGGVRAVWHQEDDLRPTMPADALALLAADWALGAATLAGKHFGFAAGLKVRLATLAAWALAIFRFRDVGFSLRRFMCLLSGRKIDGTQTSM